MTDAPKPAQPIPPMPGTMWLLGRLIAEKLAEKERETITEQGKAIEAAERSLEREFRKQMERETEKMEGHHAETHND